MFQVKCRTQNVSFKVCHSKCLKKVSFKISQKMSLKVQKKKKETFGWHKPDFSVFKTKRISHLSPVRRSKKPFFPLMVLGLMISICEGCAGQ